VAGRCDYPTAELLRSGLVPAGRAVRPRVLDCLFALWAVEDHRPVARHGRCRAVRPLPGTGKRPGKPPVPAHGFIMRPRPARCRVAGQHLPGHNVHGICRRDVLILLTGVAAWLATAW
jgi:hypothetical protein